MQTRPAALETVFVDVPESAVEAYEAALASVCATVGFFKNGNGESWRIEGVRQAGTNEDGLNTALILAALVSGASVALQRHATPAEGWLARTRAAFPEQLIGRRFAIRGSHVATPPVRGRVTLTLDAGLAFGSGEHGSTRGCLTMLERVARRRPRRLLDLGTGSGVLAIAAAKALRRPVLATDIEPWSVRVARENAVRNGVGALVRARRADGWADRAIKRAAPYDLVFANILARPLMAMARHLAINLAPGGTAILAGLLSQQANAVLAAHRRLGLHLVARHREGAWTTLILRR